MIGPHKLSGCRIDSTKEKLGLTTVGASAANLSYGCLWRSKIGHRSVAGTGLLIADAEIQDTFPEKLACGRLIDAKPEC
jgi:hypothetical protein